MLCWPRWRRCLPAFRREWKAEILWRGRSRRKHKAKAPFVRGTRSVREGVVKRCPLQLRRGHFTVPLLCHTYAKIPQETARFAKTKNDENPHKQRENPHFCGFMIWWTRRDSNPRPPRCERGALPTEPRAHILLWRSKLLTYNITIARRCQAAKGQGTRIFAHQHKLIPESRRSPAFPMRS